MLRWLRMTQYARFARRPSLSEIFLMSGVSFSYMRVFLMSDVLFVSKIFSMSKVFSVSAIVCNVVELRDTHHDIMTLQ